MNEKNLFECRSLIAGFISSRRHEMGITQQKLSEATGLGIQTIKRMEDAKFWPNLKQFLIVCNALDMYFFVEEKDGNSAYTKTMRDRWSRKKHDKLLDKKGGDFVTATSELPHRCSPHKATPQ